MSSFQFFLFGSPMLERDGTRLDFGLRKSLALLAFLSTEKQRFSRESLAAFFWPDVDHATALGNLRRALYRVNHTCEAEIITANRSSFEINQAIDFGSDTDTFQELISACLCTMSDEEQLPSDCLEKLSRASDLYHTDFMSGFSLPDSPFFDEWQFFQMENLRRSYNAVLKCLVQDHRDRGDLDRAIHYAHRRMSLDTLEEAAHRDLMELYSLNGQYGAALRQYEECCRILQVELSVKPQVETDELYRAIKQRRISQSSPSPAREILRTSTLPQPLENMTWHQKPSMLRKISTPGPPQNLPVLPFPFVGRKQELSEIRQLLLEAPERRLITLTGPGGIGKTRLAVEAAASVFRDFRDGLFLVSLTSIKDPGEIFSAVVEQIGLRSYQKSVNQDRLFGYLCEKQMLLILDSYEHLIPDVRFISELLQNAPEVKVIVTSRERLGLSSETIYSLGEMEYPQQESLKNIQEYSAVQLFLQCALLIRPQLEMSEEDMLAVGQICRSVQGMPLAIILSASWLQALTIQEIAEEIECNLDFLEGKVLDLPERQRSVRAAVAYSWKMLSQKEQTAFMRLCIFSGGFSIRSAQRVAGVSLGTLRSLIDKSFIAISQDGRYHIHELLRQFGADQLDASGEASEFRLKHSENYLALLGEHKETLKGRNQSAALVEIEIDFQNIYQAWTYALESGRSAAIYTALESLYLYCDLRGRHQVGVELFEMARQKLTNQENGNRDLAAGSVLTHLGMLSSRYKRDCPEIGNIIKEGLAIAKIYQNQPEIAFGLLALAHFLSDTMQDYGHAIHVFKQCRRLFSIVGDEYYIGRAIHMTGICYGFLDGIYELKKQLDMSLEIAKKIGDKSSEAMLLISLSMANFYLGDLDEAQKFAEEAAQMTKEIGKGASLGQTDTFLGLIYLLRGQLEKAEWYIEMGASIANEVDFPVPLIYSKAVSAVMASFAGNLPESKRYIEECRAFPLDPFSFTFVTWASALVYCGNGELAEARKEIRILFEMDEKLGGPAMVRLALPIISVILFKENQLTLSIGVLAIDKNHPLKTSDWKEVWPVFKDVSERIALQLDPDIIQAAWENGEKKTVNELVQDVLVCWQQENTVTEDLPG
jgi:predicted ATPase/DNA-binding SARP family transcriptional activator